MNPRPRRLRSLGPQAIHPIASAVENAREIDRSALQARIEAASIRPVPGTSDLLGTPIDGKKPGIGDSPRTVTVHDLIGLPLIRLVRDGLSSDRSHRVGSWEDIFSAKGSL